MSSKISVLVITNNNSRLEQIERGLVSAGIMYLTVKDSAAAVMILKETVLDVIISDTDIGQLDGWRLARMVRAGLFKVSNQTPFVLISNTHCEHIVQTTASAFAIDKVIAEDNLDNIASTIQSVLKKSTEQDNMLAVLIVEDEPDIAELAQRILKQNYYIELAGNGTQAFEKLAKRHFDIILLDVQLPGMSGTQILEQIMQKNPKQAVVIMTAHGGTDLAEQLMINGAVDFIPKPFKAEQLRKVISIAAHRENYLISHAQFSEKVNIIQRSEEKYKHLSDTHSRMLDNLSTVIMELDETGKIIFTNQAWTKLTGYTQSETQHCCLSQFAHVDIFKSNDLVDFHIENVIKGVVSRQEIEFQIEDKQRQRIWVAVILNSIIKNGKVIGVTATIDNINDRKRTEIELNHLVSHDTLTGLYNRHYFDIQLTQLANAALKQEQTHSLLYLDLDRFKVINDTQGHHQGDIILKKVAQSIMELKRESDIICRLGDDEFALLLPHTNIEQATGIAQNVCETLQQGHYQFDEHLFKISGSIGIAEINGSETQPETYLQQADIALYVAKKRGRNLVHIFTHDDRESEDFKASVLWVHTLQKAIINDQLILHFQPVIHSSSKEVAYFEALVRLQIDGKTIMPGEFIPALERAEDINLLDHQVISKAIYMMSVHKNPKQGSHKFIRTSV